MRSLIDFIRSRYARTRTSIDQDAQPTAASEGPPTTSQHDDSTQFEQARVLHQQGKLSEAGAIYHALLQKYPRDFDLLHLLGTVQGQRGNFDAAIEIIKKALQVDASNAAAHCTLGNCLKGLEQNEQALESYDRALTLQPKDADILSNRGTVLKELKRNHEALESFEQALIVNPNHVIALDNRGTVLRELQRPEEALASHDKALAINPDYALAHYNRGLVLNELERLKEAMESYANAVKINPDYVEAHWNLSLSCLQLGQFERGWKEFEWRWQAEKNAHTKITLHAPAWEGQTLNGSLLVWNEHGVGDEIFYASMLNDLQPFAQSITLCVDPRLVPLFQRSFKNMQVISRQMLTPDSRFDAHIPMGSLGRYLRPSFSAFPDNIKPYLFACSRRTKDLRSRIATPNRIICGLSWLSKNPNTGADKSLRLFDLESLLTLPGIDFVDLQYGDTAPEQAALYSATGLRLHRIPEIDNFKDLDGLAALIQVCDMVVTVSNTTAHLAAALGKPVLLMLPFSRGLLWYWYMERTVNPWYPTVTPFRQPKLGDWRSVIDGVHKKLRQQIS